MKFLSTLTSVPVEQAVALKGTFMSTAPHCSNAPNASEIGHVQNGWLDSQHAAENFSRAGLQGQDRPQLSHAA